MTRALLKTLPLCIRNVLLSPPKCSPNSNPLFVSPAVCIRFGPRLYASESESSNQTSFAQSQKPSGSVDDVDATSNQELKRQIEKCYEGDEEALSSIFEAILKRKLAGICDDDLMKELKLKPSIDDVEDKEFDSDLDESIESNHEIED